MPRHPDIVSRPDPLLNDAGAPSPDALALLDRLAHDLRAPVHNVLALAELLSADVYGPPLPAQQEPIADLVREGKRMQDLVEETLDLVRLFSGRYQAEPTEFAPQPVIERVAAGYGAIVRGLAPGTMVQDLAKLERILDRLLAQAARAGLPAVEILPRDQLDLRIAPVGEASFDPLDAPRALGPPVARALARLLGGDVAIQDGAFVLELPTRLTPA
jgi:hypothetical protein